MLILVTSSAAMYTTEWLKLDYMMKLRSSVECRDEVLQIRCVEQDIDFLLRRFPRMAAMWMWINEAYSALHKITNAFEVENLSPGSIRRYGWHGGKA